MKTKKDKQGQKPACYLLPPLKDALRRYKERTPPKTYSQPLERNPNP